MRKHALNSNEALCLGDLHADAGITPVSLRVEGRELLGRKQDAVRVIQLVDEPACSFFVESRSVDSVDEAGGNDVQDLVEEASALLAFTLLECETSGHEWYQSQAEEQAFLGSGHTV